MCCLLLLSTDFDSFAQVINKIYTKIADNTIDNKTTGEKI